MYLLVLVAVICLRCSDLHGCPWFDIFQVDIFSFGMFLYELLVLKLPFEGEESAAAGGANLKGHILSGGRPTITQKVETQSSDTGN